MIGKALLPSPALQPFIKGYQLWHFIFSDANKLPFKPYAPRAEQSLVFFPRGFELVEHINSGKLIKRPASMLMGQYIERTNRHLGAAESLIILVNFQPGVLHRITGIPFYEITNTFVDAESVFSKQIQIVNRLLNSAESYDEMIRIVETFLTDLIHGIRKEAHPIDSITNLMIENPGNSSIINLAKASFLGTRQFERKFKERMGVSPKVLVRIARMNKALKIKYNNPNEDWLRIALCCGYHDYQHLAKDFLEFARSTPNGYLAEDNQAPERYFGVRDSSLQ